MRVLVCARFLHFITCSVAFDDPEFACPDLYSVARAWINDIVRGDPLELRLDRSHFFFLVSILFIYSTILFPSLCTVVISCDCMCIFLYYDLIMQQYLDNCIFRRLSVFVRVFLNPYKYVAERLRTRRTRGITGLG